MTAVHEPETPTVAAPLPFRINPPLPHIREYRDEDAEAVARMWRESASAWPGGGPGGGEHSTAARVRQDQRDLNTLATFIAFLPDPETGEERAVGYCSLFEYTSETGTAYVGTLSAHPKWHGTGVGRDLLRASLERTIALGYTRLDLHTWAGNLKAVPLYKKSGYFWVPDTTVKMENYLPLIFRLGPAQEFFREADWYRDFKRGLSLEPDGEKIGKREVYTYTWEHAGKTLRVVIDRHAKGVAALKTDAFAVSTDVDDPRLPVGGRRQVRWRVENRQPQPVMASVLAEGEDSVRCTFQASGAVEAVREWTAPVVAEHSQVAPPPGRPHHRVHSTVVVDGQMVPLLTGTQVVQAVSIDLDGRARSLSPGVRRSAWVTITNNLDDPVRGTAHLAASSGLTLDGGTIAFDLAPRRRVSHRLIAAAHRPGVYTLRAQAGVDVVAPPAPSDGEAQPVGKTNGAAGAQPEPERLKTKIFEHSILCGEPGEVFVEQTEERVRITTDRLVLNAPLKPSGSWVPGFDVLVRETGRRVIGHSTSLGPPFVPSIFVQSTWTARVERTTAGVTLTLSTSPPALAGLVFERVIHLSPSGLMKLSFRATNTGEAAHTLQLSASTDVSLSMARSSKVAVPLVSGLVVDDAARFPDWEEEEVTRPERYAETWMAEFGDGWAGATLWSRAKEVRAGWSAPSLTIDFGPLAPGGRVETEPIYLYAGQGDWRTARALWRQLIAPDAPASDPEPRPAHFARLDRFAFDGRAGDTRIVVESERTRTIDGVVSLEVDGEDVARGDVRGLRVGAPQEIPVAIALPARAQAVAAALVLDHERTTERYEAALVRVGDRRILVTTRVEQRDARERVFLENGRLRLAFIPSQLGRMVELAIQDDTGEWVNQLHAGDPEPSTFVWFNPWYGGIHPQLSFGGWGNYPGKLREETFTWRDVERTGGQGIAWRGIAVSTLTHARDQAGLHLEVSYLTAGESNLLAVMARLENRSGARVEGSLQLPTFLQPGGDRTKVTLHYERDGLRSQKRVHGGAWGSTSGWVAVEALGGSPVLTLVVPDPRASIGLGDMGHEGVHPSASFPFDLAPDEATERVAYLAIADDLIQARLYRFLAAAGGLV